MGSRVEAGGGGVLLGDCAAGEKKRENKKGEKSRRDSDRDGLGPSHAIPAEVWHSLRRGSNSRLLVPARRKGASANGTIGQVKKRFLPLFFAIGPRTALAGWLGVSVPAWIRPGVVPFPSETPVYSL